MFCDTSRDSEDGFTVDLSPDLFTTCSSPKAVSSPLFSFLHSSQSPPLSPVLLYQQSIPPTTDIRSLSHAPSRTQFRSPQSSSPHPPHPTHLLATENQSQNTLTTLTTAFRHPLLSLQISFSPLSSLQSLSQINTSPQINRINSDSSSRIPENKARNKKQPVFHFRAMSVNEGPLIEFGKKDSKMRINKNCFHIDAFNPIRQPSSECKMILKQLDPTQTLTHLNTDRVNWDTVNIEKSSIQIPFSAITYHNGKSCQRVEQKNQTCTLLHIEVKENGHDKVSFTPKEHPLKSMTSADRMSLLLNNSASEQYWIDEHAGEVVQRRPTESITLLLERKSPKFEGALERWNQNCPY
ncbi:hypothetical protein BLNAU_4554 [Blattamonas nauphoetae]|uniref:Uncharacterized protein n=1 Tax=Blattamonas nauphoetae TaxID=2049346 RepID=A0ABQ9Y9C5_9EUKA|nr:hypothetical protein BLNAU_4554 [Blattamonas nauphoetae]